MSNGRLSLVSVGPGASAQITTAAMAAIRSSEVIVGYDLYFTWIADEIAGKKTVTTPLSQERARVQAAIDEARQGRDVALVSSGDIGIYAMATLAFELMCDTDRFQVEVFPGVTAAIAGAALLGAPLAHDFATLSLSDLMCPWAWILQRAEHIATADLCVALYNVQSRKRQEGVYTILDIMAKHKGPQTLCGVVRNAYRPDQSAQIMSLAELRLRSFDMFTTIIIGNRFTKRRRNWIYTPRGYGEWTENPTERGAAVDSSSTRTPTATSVDSPSAPRFTDDSSLSIVDRSVWLFSGTSDGNELATKLAKAGLPIVVSAATEYGASLAAIDFPETTVVSGSIGREARRTMLQAKHAVAIVDATHPFADKMSQQLIDLAQELGLPYLRFERPNTPWVDHQQLIECSNFSEAIAKASTIGKRIFLATGAKWLSELGVLAKTNDTQWFVRVTPDPDSIEKAKSAGIPQSRICAMQGPFSQEFNESLWKQWKIDCVITKESGMSGGTVEKIQAAEALKIPILVIQRPSVAYTKVLHNQEDVLAAVRTICEMEKTKNGKQDSCDDLHGISRCGQDDPYNKPASTV